MSYSDKMKTGGVVSFGPFRLMPAERLLLRDDRPVAIGGRALDLLIALIDRAGDVVSRWELMDIVWPANTVEEPTLRMHMTALRRTIGDRGDGMRYVVNVPGRGYSFVAPVQRSFEYHADAIPTTRSTPPQALPAPLQLLVGRDQAVASVSSLLLSRRFVSVIGPGGIGKTTVAVEVAHALRQHFHENEICFVDLSPFTDPTVIASAVASAVGCIVHGPDPEESLLACLADRRMLIVLDSCEHVMKAAAILAERLFTGAPSVHLLTTSREALRVEGENVYVLSPLDVPLDDAPSAVQALASPAVQLFLESAAASGYEVELNDRDAPIVARICRQLDGIPLAIELAASRVGTYGIGGTADLLENGAWLVLPGRRSARPRHQTLQAMLDWSFQLLSPSEQKLFCWMSVFAGQFSLEAAQSVASETHSDPKAIINTILSLVDKSLISISPTTGRTYFRLLDTTRTYAAAKLLESGEGDSVAKRHAYYFAHFLASEIEETIVDRNKATAYAPYMGNIQKALAWSFSDSGDCELGTRLAVHSAPLFLKVALYTECQRWCRRALDAQREEDRGTQSELKLREALAISSMWTRGVNREVRIAIDRGLELSRTLRDDWRYIHFLVGLNILLVRLGDFQGALAAAKRSAQAAHRSGGAAETVISEWMLGASYHFAGNLKAALRHCERGFKLEADTAPVPVKLFGFDQRVRARVALARSLSLLGKADQGHKTARQAIREAEGGGPISHCIALLYCIPVFLWRGAFEEAAGLIELAVSTARKYSLIPYHALGLSLKGELMIGNGDASSGVDILREALGVLKSHHHHIVVPTMMCAMAEGLARAGHPEEALALITESLEHAEQIKEIFWMPDLLRVHGEVLLASARPDYDAAEKSLLCSIDSARKQFALSWELKAAIPLARIWKRQGRREAARAILEEIYRRFKEGFGTRELIAARGLLDELNDVSRLPAK